MSITESALYSKAKSIQTIELGNLYFFENFLIAEFNEGVNISFDNFHEAKALIKEHYGETNFGFIGNRINSYSILISDAPLFNEAFKNLTAYATVTYSSFAEKVFYVENHFFEFNKKNFTSLFEAIKWVMKSLQEEALS